MNESTIDVEAAPSQAVAVRQELPPPAPSMWGTDDPGAIIERATLVASKLKAVMQSRGLISKISGREYPKCEAWTLAGTLLGVFPVLVWTRPVEGGWEARVEARMGNGAVVGAAEAECLRAERNWQNRDDFALRSMAQTRATAKCLRMPLGFVMSLTGVEPTPAEEMVSDHPRNAGNAPGRNSPSAHTTPSVKTPPRPSSARPEAQKPPSSAKIPFPTAESRAKMIAALNAGPGQPDRVTVGDYFRKLENPAQLMPGEALEDLPLRFVPATKRQMWDLIAKIREYDAGIPATVAFPPHPEPETAPKADPKGRGGQNPPYSAPTASETSNRTPSPTPTGTTSAKPKDDEWWRDVIVPVPHKGQKRAEYEAHPETIGQLFDMRHGQDEESQAARQRLWGFINHYEAKGWTKRDGTKMPPSAHDLKFREALDALAEWHKRNCPGEKL